MYQLAWTLLLFTARVILKLLICLLQLNDGVPILKKSWDTSLILGERRSFLMLCLATLFPPWPFVSVLKFDLLILLLQFVLFYACSLDPENCGRRFADTLFHQFKTSRYPEWRWGLKNFESLVSFSCPSHMFWPDTSVSLIIMFCHVLWAHKQLLAKFDVLSECLAYKSFMILGEWAQDLFIFKHNFGS